MLQRQRTSWPHQNPTWVSKAYNKIQKMKKVEEQKCHFVLLTTYAIDTFVNDLRFTNDFSNMCSSVLTIKDSLDSSLIASVSLRRVVKRKELMSMVKLFYMVYKFVIYKFIISHMLDEINNEAIRLSVDYTNLIVDHLLC
jgi:hypothetical protein